MKKLTLSSGVLILLALAVMPVSVRAGLLVEENFESYPVGVPVANQAGGTGWAGAWAVPGNSATVVDTSSSPLTFTPNGGGLISGGARALELSGTASAIAAVRQVSNPLPDVAYVAFLARVSAGAWSDTDTLSLHLAPDGTSTSSPNFGFRGPTVVMARTGTGTPAPEGTFTADVPNNTFWLVARVSRLDGNGNPSTTYDRLEVWVNPAVTDDVNVPNGHLRLQMDAGTGPSTITHLFWRIAVLEAGDAIQVDRLVVATTWNEVVNPVGAPNVLSLQPGNGQTFWPAANGLSFQVTSTEPVDPAQISLRINGTDVSPSLVFEGEPTARTVAYRQLQPNIFYTAQITVTSPYGTNTYQTTFDTLAEPSAKVIELEDYNYDVFGWCDLGMGGPVLTYGGAYQNDPPASGFALPWGERVGGLQNDGSRLGYVEAPGYPEVDFHDSATSPDPFEAVYRPCDPVGTRIAGDQRRAKYLSASLPEYEVCRVATGDWMNYTRNFAAANYRVYLRVASTGQGMVQLARVTGDLATTNQTAHPAGVFLVPNTGGTNRYVYVPLTDASGQTEISVPLSGLNTLRLTALNAPAQMGLNFLVLLQGGESLIPPVVELQTPAADAVYPEGAAVPIAFTATDADGTVTQAVVVVSTATQTNVLATFAGPPYSLMWSNIPNGVYTLVVRAYDNQGLVGSSSAVTITVGTPPQPILLVVGNTSLNAGDQSVYNRLAALNLPIVVKAAADTVPADANDVQLIVISSTVSSGTVGNKFTDAAKPVITWEQALADDLLLTSAAGANVANENSVEITAEGAAHPAGGGLSPGALTVRNTSTTFHLAAPDQIAPGAVIIARGVGGNNNRPAILAVETGSLLNNSAPAPARRVYMFWGDEGLVNVNDAGLRLFDAAIYWALGWTLPPLAPPALSASLEGGNLVIAWPADSLAILEENDNLGNPQGWIPSTLPVQSDGHRKSVTVAPTEGMRFFRLRQ